MTSGQVPPPPDDTDAQRHPKAAEAGHQASLTDLPRTEAEAARSRTLFAHGPNAMAPLHRAVSAKADPRDDRAGAVGRPGADGAADHGRIIPAMILTLVFLPAPTAARFRVRRDASPVHPSDAPIPTPEAMRNRLAGE